MNQLNRLLDVPSTDPDDARRRRLLNILLAGIAPLTLLTWVATVVADIAGWFGAGEAAVLYLVLLPWSIGLAIVFVLNRRGPGWLASALFLLALTGVVAFGDIPEEVATGRALLMFAIPIMMASVLLRPYASFIAAGVSSVAILIIALNAHLVPNTLAVIAFSAIALVSWLAAQTLERALKDLRILNIELDQRVQDRTRDLAEALAKNQAILDSTADGVIVFDNDNEAVVANPAITGLLGQSSEEIVGRDIEALMREKVSSDNQETVVALLGDKEASHSGIKFEWGKKTFSVSLAPVRDNYDRVTGTVVVFRDFTREAEVDRMKSTFVSIASHELRTPLNAILGYTEMLQEGVYGKLTDQQRGAMDRLMANTGHMLGLVNNLLDRARMEAGTLTLNITAFAPAELVTGVHGVMGVMAQSKGLKLVTRVADDMPARLFGDWQRLHQILINLVGNAIKFTEEGTVSVRIYPPDADHWTLEVTDTGVGIPEEARSYIFDPFRQVDDTATREYGGAGLGLSIVKQLIDLMGGEIKLESKVNQGSTFTVVLPLMLSAPEEVERSAGEGSA